ncbi:MAG: hypothetical protein NVS3B21_00690 [Acidimicrobiales bacterium]
MDLQSFIESLHRLDAESITAAAAELDEASASAAGEVSWWRATVEIDRMLRERRASRAGACAATAAAAAVMEAASLAGILLPDVRVTVVARAAADVARGLVVEASATQLLLAGCAHLNAA